MNRATHWKSRAAATVVETLVTVSITVFAISAVYVGTITLQKSYRAAQLYSTTQAGQVRVIDYVALDLRRAVNWTASTSEVTMKIPNYYDKTDPNRQPKASKNGEVYYGSSPADLIQVRYYTVKRKDSYGRQVCDVMKEVIEGGTTKRTVLVSGAEDFQPIYAQDDPKKQVVSTKISFPPAFRPFIDSGSVYRDGTTTYATTMVRNKR